MTLRALFPADSAVNATQLVMDVQTTGTNAPLIMKERTPMGAVPVMAMRLRFVLKPTPLFKVMEKFEDTLVAIRLRR